MGNFSAEMLMNNHVGRTILELTQRHFNYFIHQHVEEGEGCKKENLLQREAN